MDLRASLDGDGRITAWSHETYSDTYSMRPASRPRQDGRGAAAVRPLPRRAAGAARHGPGDGAPYGHPPQSRPALRPAAEAPCEASGAGHAAPGLGAALARRLRQCLRHRILHGRTGGGSGLRPRYPSGSATFRTRAVAPSSRRRRRASTRPARIARKAGRAGSDSRNTRTAPPIPLSS